MRVWYRRYGICAQDVVCPDKLDNGMQHQYPEQPFHVFFVAREIHHELSVQEKCLGSSESQTGD